MTSLTAFARIVGVTPSQIDVEITDVAAFEASDVHLEVGAFLRISDEGGSGLIAAVRSYSIREALNAVGELEPRIVIQAQPIGSVDANGTFVRGASRMAIPPKRVELASDAVLEGIFGQKEKPDVLSFGTLQQSSAVRPGVAANAFLDIT